MNTRGSRAHSKLSDLPSQTIRLWAAEGQDENGAEVNGPTVELSLSISQFEDYVFDVESGFYSVVAMSLYDGWMMFQRHSNS